jgi:SAM-dependent methyltransferase
MLPRRDFCVATSGSMTEDYEYRGLMAQAWDLLRGDTSEWPDRAFYRALIEQGGGPVLDVGCGTGRLLLDYLAAGLDVDGVDNSPEMLALCRAKAAAANIDVASHLFEQEMATLALPRRYATIIVPSSSFQLMTDAPTAAQAMTRFFEHLAPGGILVMSIMSKVWPGRRTPAHMQRSDWHRLVERQRPEDSATIRRWVRARHDLVQQLQHEENRYELLHDGVVVETESHVRSPTLRWYTQAQAIACYEQAGFTNVTATSGFSFEPAAPEDTLFCVVGTRP